MLNINTRRKTRDTWEIWADYGIGPESVTGSENYADAKGLLKVYRENEPNTHHWIKKVREKNPDYIPTPFERIICKVDCTYGAPMGRSNTIPDKKPTERIYDRRVPFINGACDAGNAYWGYPANLRVRYTRSLSYVEFYRVGDIPKY